MIKCIFRNGDCIRYRDTVQGHRNVVIVTTLTNLFADRTRVTAKNMTKDRLISGRFTAISYKRQGHARKSAAIRECRIPDARHRGRDLDARKATAILECPLPDARHRGWDLDARKDAATRECITPDEFTICINFAGSDRLTCRTLQIEIRIICRLDINQIVHRVLQSAATGECPIPDARYRGRDLNARKFATIIECIIPDACALAPLGKCHARKFAATRECRVPDARHRGRNRNARKSATPFECILPDARHGIAFDGIWNIQCAAGIFVAIGNSDLAVGNFISQIAIG